MIKGNIHLELNSLAPADPVALLGLYSVWPVNILEIVYQSLGILRDLEIPLGNPALLNQGTGTLSTSADSRSEFADSSFD